MTVEELITQLQTVKDKTKPVTLHMFMHDDLEGVPSFEERDILIVDEKDEQVRILE